MTAVCIPTRHCDMTFAALGTDVRVIVDGHDSRALVARVRREILDYHARLTRFEPASELSRLNADPRPVVPASGLLRDAVRAAVWAAERSGGLVDPCLLDALEAAGYATSFSPGTPLAPHPALPRPARPHPAALYRRIAVGARTIARPPGLRLDLGGTGKGHVADLVARHLGRARSWVVDAGGDVRVGGDHEILVEHPLGDEPAARIELSDAAVATSSVTRRAWREPGGGTAHHLLDPATGRPAHTGLLAVSAIASTTLEAETLAKTALLRGPAGAAGVLAACGGLAVHAGGSVSRHGPLAAS